MQQDQLYLLTGGLKVLAEPIRLLIAYTDIPYETKIVDG